MNAAVEIRANQLMTRQIARRTDLPDGWYETSLEAFGTELGVSVGYRVIDWGTAPRTWNDAHGEVQHEQGEAPRIEIVAWEVHHNDEGVLLPKSMLDDTQLRTLGDEIVETVTAMRDRT